MKIGFLLLALSVAACSAPAVDQASCAYGAARECFDGRDGSVRFNRDNLADRTRLVAVSTLDATNRSDRDDLSNRTRARADSVLDATNRASRDDLTNRSRMPGVSDLDATRRANRDDTTDRTRACP